MPNPLDIVTQDESDVPLAQQGMRGISIRPYGGGSDVASGGNALTQALAPEQPAQQPWTMDDLMKGLAALKEYVATGEFSPGTKVGNRLFGTGGEERYQTWPEKMVRSGVGAAGNALSSLEPVTSEQLIAPAMDMAGMAGGSALTQRGGSATLGSGPVRRTNMGLKPDPRNAVYEGAPSPSMRQTKVPLSEYRYQDLESLVEDHIKQYGLPDKAEVVPVKDLRATQHNVDKHHDWDSNPDSEPFGSDLPLGIRGSDGKVHLVDGNHTSDQAIRQRKKTVDVYVINGSKLFSDTTKPGAAISAAASASKGPAPVFYSALEHAATNAAQDVMTSQQWLGYLKNQPGVKQEELAWTGIGDWLGAQKGKVKKEDVQRYLDEHKVEIKDVTKSGPQAHDEVSNDLHDRAVQAVLDAFLEQNPRWEGRTHTAAFQRAHEQFVEGPEGERIWRGVMEGELQPEGAVKYSDYQLPGGENYREHLLTLPPPSRARASDVISAEMTAKYGRPDWLRVATPEDRQRWYREGYVKQGSDDAAAGTYRSSHWDEPNVLAHVRTNDRTIDGKKALHIEEIQSDWHQQGRKEGYTDLPRVREINAELDKLTANKTYDPDEYNWLIDQRNQATAIPNAPFKTSWPELALKRMIRHAAENDYDRISWTPGEAQAARYDLSKQLDALQVTRLSNGSYHLAGKRAGNVAGARNTVFETLGNHVPEGKLADTIGKEMAERVVKQEGNEPKEYSGLDLKVGGEGMREFYDKMLPRMAEKIGKAHGVKVKQAIIDHMEPKQNKDGKWYLQDKEENGGFATKLYDTREEAVKAHAQPVHYFDIPQSLRDHAIGKGFPLYMTGVPFPLVPVDHDPFKKKEK